MKAEKFLYLYAKEKEQEILSYGFEKELEQKALNQISGALKARERGMITRDEAVNLILSCLQ